MQKSRESVSYRGKGKAIMDFNAWLVDITGEIDGFMYTYILLILLVAGCVLEALSAVVILAPILIPVGLAMGLEPMHLAVVFCVTMTIGIVTPPFGGVLFTTVSITKTPFGEVAKGEIPYIFAMILVCVLIAIFPDLALWLPNLMQS